MGGRVSSEQSDRPDAVFHDRFARKLAGSRGQEIADAMPYSERQAWAWVARTYVIDQLSATKWRKASTWSSTLPPASTPDRTGWNCLPRS